MKFKDYVYYQVKKDLKEMFNVDVIEAEVNGVRGYSMEFNDNCDLETIKQKISDYFKSNGLRLTNFLQMEK